MFDAARNIHPGEILRTNYVTHSDLSLHDLEQRLSMPVLEVAIGDAGICAEYAEELAETFDVPVSFWIQLQKEYQAEKQRQADSSVKGRLQV